MKIKSFLLITIIVLIHQIGFSEVNNVDTTNHKIKYIFYFIGDGMGLAQSHAAELYLASKNNSPEPGFLNMNKLPYQTFYTTQAANRYITGSAASATAMSSGYKTSINTIGMDGLRKKDLKPISLRATEKGMKVGIITSVSIDHATPAGFYAHEPKREMYYEIGLDLVRSNFDFFAGGGFVYPDGKYKDKDTNLIEYAKTNGYQFINSKKDFLNLNPPTGKILAFNENLDISAAMPYSMDNKENDLELKDIITKAIDVLDNENGFFIMLEGGKIDWTCHMNDAAGTIKEVIAFDDAVGIAMDFYEKHPNETVILVSADHETGGLSLGSALKKYSMDYKLIDFQKSSMEKLIEKYTELDKPNFKEALTFIKDNLGLNGPAAELQLTEYDLKRLKKAFKDQNMGMEVLNNPEAYEAYGSYHPFISTAIKIFNQKIGIDFTTWAHTGIPVPLRFIGLDPEVFNGLTDNTDIPKQIQKALEIK